jgi:hypothetical protein
MKSTSIKVYSVLTVLHCGAIEWLYGTYSTKAKAEKVVKHLKKNKRIGRIITGHMDIL